VSTIQLLSPVDGSIYAERETSSTQEIERATTDARNAVRKWRTISIADRAALCTAAVDAMLAMESEIVPELAWQMGRPVRYGPGELNGFEFFNGQGCPLN
jgi:acyl-CoA reductase-like NAD-dependent aldehyde dehydrogenase